MLKRKAVASLRRAMSAFNGLDDDARNTTVLVHLQHAFEMLLKASLHEHRYAVVDQTTGQSLGFKKCLNLAQSEFKLPPETVGLLRAIDQLRDDEYHYLGLVSEGILFVHLRAAVTIFDQLLQAVFAESLADHLPARVLPISTQPPEDLSILIDREYSQVKTLLEPGRRHGAEVRARIRTLLALEGHTTADAEVRDADVRRVAKAIRGGQDRSSVFPRLEGLSSRTIGLEVSIRVHTTRTDGVPVRFVPSDETGEAGAVRDVDLQKRYPFTKKDLADQVGLTAPRASALRAHLGMEGDDAMHHQFTFGHTTHDCYSHAALRAMREALASGLDMDDVWANHRPRPRR
jgi:hypothetical protein